MSVSRGLQEAVGSVRREVAASRLAWPLIDHGLPREFSAALRDGVSTASIRAKEIVTPPFLGGEAHLTRPAAGIAGDYESFLRLTERGWSLTGTTIGGIAGDSPATVRFLRANSGLYIDCVYDGHFALGLIGASLLGAYHKLGGPTAFGQALTQDEVEAIARAYSPSANRLQPHPSQGLGV